VFHTDRGIEYSAGAFKESIAKLCFIQSMNRPGTLDNVAALRKYAGHIDDLFGGVSEENVGHSLPLTISGIALPRWRRAKPLN
jgi:hypothetical protein